MGAFTYPRSEPGSGGHLDLVEQLNATTAALRAELAGLADAVLTHRPSEQDWSIKELLGHLCDSSQTFHRRLYRVINLEEPRLETYDHEGLVRQRNANAAGIEELLSEFAAQRAQTVDLLADLVHWNWARCGRHPERGRISIRQLVDRAIAHDADHVEQIRRLKAAGSS